MVCEEVSKALSVEPDVQSVKVLGVSYNKGWEESPVQEDFYFEGGLMVVFSHVKWP